MKFLLDTDICSYIIKDPSHVRKRFNQIHFGEIAISAITWAELHSWVALSSKPEQRLMSLQKMFAPIAILPFTQEDASLHGSVWKRLKEDGQLIGALDMLIAAHALSRNLIVVTNNSEHFRRVPGLIVENWQ